MKLDYNTINSMCGLVCGPAALAEYIYQRQGLNEERLDYKAAARFLSVSVRTVGRYVQRLAANNIIIVNYGKLKINSKFLAV